MRARWDVIVYRVSPGRQSEQAVDRWRIKPVERLDATERRKSFWNDFGSVLSIHPASSRGFSKIDPVCRAIAGSIESCGVDECFQQQRRIPIMLPPVIEELAGGAGQNGRRQSFHTHPRQNQETAVVDDVLQVPSALRGTPTNPVIARRHLPCRTGPLKASEHLAGGGLNEVA